MPDTILTVGDGVSHPNNTIILHNVYGENIIFKNFRGRATQLTREGDRSFCLIIPNRLIRDQLAARGCNIKKLKDKDIEFVNVAVRFVPPENVDDIWGVLDTEAIDQASLEFTFYEWNINGKKGTKIYLKNARFYVKGFNDNVIIDIRYPGNITCKVDNTNNTEETNMEKMTRAEVMGQLQFAITAFRMEEKSKNDPVVVKLMDAIKNAIEYIGEVPKSETKVKTVTVEKKVPVLPEIKQVIFNYPATVVIWDDDVKTVVECQKGDNYSMESGLAMCIAKRMMGNKSNFNKQIKKYTENVKNVQTKKKPKEGTFAERKAERMAQAEANKTAKSKSKAGKKKALDKARKNVKDTSNVAITEAYINHVRVKMAKRGIKNYSELAKVCGVSQTTFSRCFGNSKRKSKVLYRKTFNKINKALGIRWG